MRSLVTYSNWRRGWIPQRERIVVRFDSTVTAETPLRIGRGTLRRGSRRGSAGYRRILLFAAMLVALCGSIRSHAGSCPLFIPASAVGYYNSYFYGAYSSTYYTAGATPGLEERNFF